MNNNNYNHHNNNHNNNHNKKYYYDYFPNKMPPYLVILTHNIQYFYQNNINSSSRTNTESIFWDDIYCLLSDPNKYYILKKWKYGRSFFLTEKAHENNYVLFGVNVTWELSFILGLLMYEYHS